MVIYNQHSKFAAVRVDVPVLNHSNWKLWSFKIQTQLRFYKLMCVVDGDFDNYTLLSEEYKAMNQTALDQIKLNVDEYYFQMIEECSTAKHAFSKLRDHFEGNRTIKGMRLIGELSNGIVNKSSDLDEIVIRFKNCVKELRNLYENDGSKIPEGLLISILLNQLESKFDYLIKDIVSTEMKSATRQTSSLDDILSNLMCEAQLLRSKESDSMKKLCAIHSASEIKPGEKWCLFCKKNNHNTTDCFKLKRAESGSDVQQKTTTKKKKRKSKSSQKEEVHAETNQQTSSSATASNSNTNSNTKIRTMAILSATGDTGDLDPLKYYLDTGCSNDVVSNLAGCVSLSQTHTSPVYTASDTPVQISGTGTFEFIGSNDYQLRFTRVHYVPKMCSNFISYSNLDKHGFSISGRSGYLYIHDSDGTVMMTGKLIKSGLYELDIKPKEFNSRCLAIKDGQTKDQKQPDEVMRWHYVLSHLNLRDMKRIEKHLNLKIDLSIPLQCLVCKVSKMIRFPFPHVGIRSERPLQMIHSDLSGIIRLSNTDGYRYFVIFLDDYTRYRMVFLLSRKYQVLEAFRQYKTWMENQTGRKIQILHTDNGTEYCNSEFDKLIQDSGIQRELTIPHTPSSNGVSERDMRTIAEAARSNLIGANLSINFWPQAVGYSVYSKNRVPHSSINGRIPMVEMFGEPVRYERMQKFGCLCIVLELQPANKFSQRGNPAILVGYPAEHSGYEVYLLEKQSFSIAREVYFLSDYESSQFIEKYHDQFPVLENRQLLSRLFHKESDTTQDRFIDDASNLLFTRSDDENSLNERIESNDLDNQESRTNRLPAIDPRSSTNTTDQQESSSDSSSLIDLDPYARILEFNRIDLSDQALEPVGRFVLNRTNFLKVKDRFPNAKFEFVGPHASSTRSNKRCLYRINAIRAPKNYKEAMQSPEADRWRAAMLDEHNSLINNNTFTKVKRPPNTRVLPVMWVFTNKTNKYGELIKHKARCVVLGNKQLNVNPSEVNAPVVNSMSLRIMLSIAVTNGFHIETLDIKTAYLHAELKEEVYIQQLPGFNDDPNFVLKLNKSLYGLRSSAKNFYNTVVRCLKEFGLKQSYSDECMFSNEAISIVELIIVVLHVDDMAMATKHMKKIDEFKAHLTKTFEVSFKGTISEFLGLNFEYDKENRCLSMNQSSYINQIVERFGMSNCKQVKTPIGTDVKIMIPRDHNEKINQTEVDEFSEMVGAVGYVANASRPDINFVSSVLCRYIGVPAQVHCDTAKRMIRYLRSTVNSSIVYRANSENRLVVYADADHANYNTCESISGVAALLNGNLISWSSYKQSRVATATCESEVLSSLDGINEIEYIVNLLNELKIDIGSALLFNDNLGAIKTAESGGVFKSNKHYKIRINRIRRAMSDGLVEIKYCSTESMIADVLTKQLGFDKYANLLKIANVNIERN